MKNTQNDAKRKRKVTKHNNVLRIPLLRDLQSNIKLTKAPTLCKNTTEISKLL